MTATRDGDGDGLQRSDESADPADFPQRLVWRPGSGVAAPMTSGIWKLHAEDAARMRRNFSYFLPNRNWPAGLGPCAPATLRTGLASVRHKTSCHREAATPFGPSLLLRGRGIVSQVIRNSLI